MAKKLSTNDILAQLRAEQQGANSGEAAATSEPVEASEPVVASEQVVAAEAPAKPSSAKPSSTADILAAARAEKASAPAKPAGGAPKGTADILAALRAEKAGGAAPTAETKPAAKKPAAPATLPDGEKPSVEEMLRNLRGEKSEAAPAAPAKPTLPPRPVKPAAKQKPQETRRNVLVALVATPFAAAWTMFCATAAAATLGMARFMMPNVLVEPPSRFKVGPPSDYPPGTVSTKWKAQFGVWLVHAEYEGDELVYALSSVCTHLGCTPNWLEGEQKFKCPCHGSGFYISGINFEGPAPRPLERHGIRLAPDGMLEVDKAQKFQQELGQWEDANSKVEIV